ncbi:unnamed protein product [Brachionus calyciflorus]|uniref:Uncharacterized protein n=1 Tax=Brachionus calyciflorus TaxID=104777 RepID=A0A814BC36_9BILA|nr:unnamed protein product [Brachionus calyciflorus]
MHTIIETDEIEPAIDENESNDQKLKKSLKDNEFLNIIYQNKSLKIEKLIRNKLVYYEKFPSDYINALFSSYIYYNLEKRDNKKILFVPNDEFELDANTCKLRNETVKDWEIAEIYNQDKPYYGVLFINTQTKKAVLASRATIINLKDLTSPSSDLKKDSTKFFLDNFVFLKSVPSIKKLIAKIYYEWVQGNGFKLALTGHGIGAWYSSFQWFNLPEQKFKKNVKVVVFDSPYTDAKITYFYNNHITYLSHPNFLNTFNQHHGQMYFFLNTKKPKISKELEEILNGLDSKAINFIIYGILGFNQNGIENFLQIFDSKTGRLNYSLLNKVDNWPPIGIDREKKLNLGYKLRENSDDLVPNSIYKTFQALLTAKTNWIKEESILEILKNNLKFVKFDPLRYEIKLKYLHESLIDYFLIKEIRLIEDPDSYLSKILLALQKNLIIELDSTSLSVELKENNTLGIENMIELSNILDELDDNKEGLKLIEANDRFLSRKKKAVKENFLNVKEKSQKIYNSKLFNLIIIGIFYFAFPIYPFFVGILNLDNQDIDIFTALLLIINSIFVLCLGIFLLLRHYTIIDRVFELCIALLIWFLFVSSFSIYQLIESLSDWDRFLRIKGILITSLTNSAFCLFDLLFFIIKRVLSTQKSNKLNGP